MKKKTVVQMFPDSDDLPLFSGVPMRAAVPAFIPQETAPNLVLPGFELRMPDAPKKLVAPRTTWQ